MDSEDIKFKREVKHMKFGGKAGGWRKWNRRELGSRLRPKLYARMNIKYNSHLIRRIY